MEYSSVSPVSRKDLTWEYDAIADDMHGEKHFRRHIAFGCLLS